MLDKSASPVGGRPRVRLKSSAALALVLGAALVNPSIPAQAVDVGPIPVLAQWRGNTVKDFNEVVMSVHGVRRVPGATVVYWSLGYPNKNVAKPAAADLVSIDSPTYALSTASSNDTLDNVAIMDPATQKIYSPLYRDGKWLIGTGYSGLPLNKIEAGKAYVAWIALPPLPEGTNTVDLFIAGRPYFDIPVQDGLLEPQVEGKAPVVGTGWPTIDVAESAEAGPTDKFLLDYTVNSKFSDAALARRDSAAEDNLDLASDVLFAVDKATLTSKAKDAISKAAGQVKDSGATSITVTGHTDSDADDAYNLKLSKARAEAVAKALKPLRPGTVKITTEGKGETEPIADNTTAEGKAKNRRVTITIPKAASK